jgi:uncharacterized protein YeeX (DUF496 family)
MEDGIRRHKFVELAEKRVTKAIKDLRLIGNLSNPTNYSFSHEDVRQIISALQKEVKALRQRFDSSSSSEETVFKLNNGSGKRAKNRRE